MTERLAVGRMDAGGRAKRRSPGPARRGFTLVEALVTLLIVTALLALGVTLLTTASRAYDDVIWQPRVEQEAQQALDDICDTLRLGGTNDDLLLKLRTTTRPQVSPQIGAATAPTVSTVQGGRVTYQIQTSPTTGTNYLTRQYRSGPVESVAAFVTRINFEFEYREVAPAGDMSWHLTRVNDLSSWNGTTTNPVYLIDVIYVSVTASVTPYPSGPSYQRTLRSAVHLRGPFNASVPPAIAAGP